MTESSLPRRAFLRTAATAAAAVGVAGTLSGTAHAGWGHGTRRIPLHHISVQLYTLRSLMQDDPDGTLGALADIGYRCVELAGTYGRSATEFRALLDKHHLRATSAHVGFDGADVDQLIADAKILGYHKADCAWASYSTVADWTAFAQRLEQAGKAFREAGIAYGYHNHAHEYQPIDGVRPIDIIARNTTRQNIHFEYDLYWVVTGGADPVEEYYRYFGRVKQFHVKDRAADGGFADLGTGTIDFARIFRDTWRGGMKQYIVEHDQPTDPLSTAKVGFEYLRDLRF
ncbi:sugar phosphate isomerase/epimerase family protein [Prauserella muralis]|uniref:Sugar phosphate isomerase n=1 Tax=Prauserella muralis TaxID=588067 RepID=A0A2V4AZ90_9PSEU|nr:sugar phosphate isomerase/epimerase [Prauserella muralis]PXY27310.1 sugar phosphate isomerase [Prauserella muralis]TWE23011.1 sugar phosphate isomerase/epimerase [Prauserella muralis]